MTIDKTFFLSVALMATVTYATILFPDGEQPPVHARTNAMFAARCIKDEIASGMTLAQVTSNENAIGLINANELFVYLLGVDIPTNDYGAAASDVRDLSDIFFVTLGLNSFHQTIELDNVASNFFMRVDSILDPDIQSSWHQFFFPVINSNLPLEEKQARFQSQRAKWSAYNQYHENLKMFKGNVKFYYYDRRSRQ